MGIFSLSSRMFRGLFLVILVGLLATAALVACGSEQEPTAVPPAAGVPDAGSPEANSQPEPASPSITEPAAEPAAESATNTVTGTAMEPAATPQPVATPLVVGPSQTRTDRVAAQHATGTGAEGQAPVTGLVYTDIGPDTTWGDVFESLSEEEQSCIRNEVGDEMLGVLSEEPFNLETPPALDIDAMMGCVSDEVAAEIALAEMSLQVGGLSDEEAVCMRMLMAEIPIQLLIGAEAAEPTPETALLQMSYGLGMLNCLPRLAEGSFAGTPQEGGGGGSLFDDPSLLWSFTTGGWVLTAPAVVDGVVYAGSDDYSLYALDAATGDQIWSFATDDVIRSTPTVVDGRVFFGSNDNHLYALDAATGAELWKYDTGEWVQYSPSVSHGAVYLATQGDAGQKVVALDAETGASKWVADVAAPVEPDYTPIATGGQVYVAGSTYGEFYALDAATGETVWQAEVGGYVESAPTALDGVVYLTVVNRAYAFDEATGEVIWEVNTEEFPARDFPALVVDGVYFLAPSDKVYALNADTGDELWSYEPFMLSTAPVVADGVLFGASELAEYIFALDTATGEELWTESTEDLAAHSLQVADGMLYGQLDNGYLFANDAALGWQAWGTDIGGFSDVKNYTVADGVVYFGGVGNEVRAHVGPEG